MTSFIDVIADASLARAILSRLSIDDKFRLAPISRGTFAAFSAECKVIAAACSNPIRAAEIGSDILFRKHFTPENSGDALVAAAKFGRATMVTFAFDEMDDFTDCPHERCRTGRGDAQSHLLDLGWFNIAGPLNAACKGGHVEIAKLLVKRIGAFHHCVKCAYQNGSADIIAFVDGCFASNPFDTHGIEMTGACRGGHAELVDRLTAHGVRDYYFELDAACKGGHINIAKKILPFADPLDVDRALGSACRSGSVEMVDLLVANGTGDFTTGLCGACRGGHPGLAEKMIQLGATNFADAFDMYRVGHVHRKSKGIAPGYETRIAQLLLPHLPRPDNVCMLIAASIGDLELVKHFNTGALDSWNGCLRIACVEGYAEIAKFAIDSGANDFSGALKRAAGHGQVEMGRLLLDGRLGPGRTFDPTPGADSVMRRAFAAARARAKQSFIRLLFDAGLIGW